MSIREDGLTMGILVQEGRREQGQRLGRTGLQWKLGAREQGLGLLKRLSCIPRAVGSSESVFKPLRSRIRFSVVKRS